LAVVISADKGTMIEEPTLDTMCSLYPHIHPLVRLKPHSAYSSIPERGTIPLSIKDDLCHTLPLLALIRVLSVARI